MTHPGLPEKIALAILIGLSLAAFWYRFRRIVHVIAAAAPDAAFTIGDLVPRVRDFVWEVMLQGKVIQQRPAAGLAHAFVFWGFCAFALITVNHIAMGFGVPFLSREGGFGRAYFAFVAVFAIAVAVAILALAIRRFMRRPIWLGKVSPESGVIAGLIFLLMVTYLAGYVADENGVAGHAAWWAHTMTLVAFLPLVPHTKHLHLMLSPVTIFLKRPIFSDIPELSGDEDFGLVAGKNVTKLDALQAYSCVECGRCTEHCPAYNTGKVLNPKEIILGLRSYLNSEGPRSEAPLLGAHISEEAAFQCTTCGGCEFQCPVGIQHLPIIVGLRRGAVNTGSWEDSYGTKLFLTMERNGNSLGLPTNERQSFIQKNELPIYDGTQEYCLWLGCMGGYDPQGREIVLALTKILRYLNITFGVLSSERCTGDPARRLGNDLAISQLAENNIEKLRAANVKKMLSICPHCVRTIGQDWGEFGGTFEIEHHTELLARFQTRLPTDRAADSIVYHDPCYLGRYRGIYDQPRKVLAGFGEMVDPPRARERSFCCGAGGGQMFLGEEKGERVNVTRAKELAATGASVIGTACPFCQSMFRDALGAVTQSPPKLRDVAQIVAARML